MAHWQIGLAYAKYLSPGFHMWCNTVARARMEGKPVGGQLPSETLEQIERGFGIMRILALTDMWKAAVAPDGRGPSDWNDLISTKEFVHAVEAGFNAGKSGIITKKGRNGGTMAHWQIGLAYAKYLSPGFHMWCNTVVRAHMEGKPVGGAQLPAETMEQIERSFGIMRMLAGRDWQREPILCLVGACKVHFLTPAICHILASFHAYAVPCPDQWRS